MKKAVALILIIGTLFPILHSCKKYEEGPWISFRSKEKRLTGIWDLIEATKSNGSVVPDSLVTTGLSFGSQLSGGNCSFHTVNSDTVHLPCSWYWSNKKESLSIYNPSASSGISSGILSVSHDIKIKRLKLNELWLEAEKDGERFTYKYNKSQ